jgi:hypothetical protein
MTVEVINMQGGGGSAPVLNFSDSFQRPDEPFYVGDNWYPVMSQGMLATGSNIAANTNIAANNLVLTTPAAVPNAVFIPRLVSTNKIVGRNQFSQIKVTAYNVAAQLNAGQGVWFNPQASLAIIGYYLRLSSNAGNVQAKIVYGFSPITTPAGATDQVIAIGDTIRIEARDNGASNEVKIIVNAVTIQTITDASANRPRAINGIYGIAFESGSGGGSASFQNYSGGVL